MTVKNINRKIRIKNKVKMKPDCKKLVVFRSNKNIYAQIIDINGKVLVAGSDLVIKEKMNKCKKAEIVGKNVADKAIKLGIKGIIFDRNGYKYHGRVLAIAKGAREAGLIF
jgi:large subunit ribosomal protein L18